MGRFLWRHKLIVLAATTIILTLTLIASATEIRKNKQEIQQNKTKIEQYEGRIETLEQEKNKSEDQKKELQDLKKAVEELKVSRANKKLLIASAHAEAVKTPQATPPQVSGGNNETVVWNFLVGQGFTRNQAAGIMGNLQQEHGFKTDGDGLAQWNGSRKANFMAMSNPYSIDTQLAYLMVELNGGYAGVKNGILATNDVATAVRVFQNGFERCGDCRETNRIKFANEILSRH